MSNFIWEENSHKTSILVYSDDRLKADVVVCGGFHDNVPAGIATIGLGNNGPQPHINASQIIIAPKEMGAVLRDTPFLPLEDILSKAGILDDILSFSGPTPSIEFLKKTQDKSLLSHEACEAACGMLGVDNDPNPSVVWSKVVSSLLLVNNPNEIIDHKKQGIYSIFIEGENPQLALKENGEYLSAQCDLSTNLSLKFSCLKNVDSRSGSLTLWKRNGNQDEVVGGPWNVKVHGDPVGRYQFLYGQKLRSCILSRTVLQDKEPQMTEKKEYTVDPLELWNQYIDSMNYKGPYGR